VSISGASVGPPRNGRIAGRLIEDCLERIARREPEVQAWTWLCPEWALAQADEAGRFEGERPLHGVPIGVKDIIDTEGRPTSYGSPIYADHVPTRDASIVAIVRQLGGIVLGKTVTTEFALFQPGKTTNPNDQRRTPGGSSSGSAAAVADGMVPWAIGTQTAGSVIRPASFCGCVGYKPTFGWLQRSGVRAVADSLDTLGVFARTVEDAAYLVAALSSRPELRLSKDHPTPAIAMCRTPQWPAAAPELAVAWEEAKRRLSRAGLSTREVALPTDFEQLTDAQSIILKWEVGRSCAYEVRSHRAHVSGPTAALVEAGLSLPSNEYDRAQVLALNFRRRSDSIFDGADVLIVPSAPGEAPEGLESTGDPIFNKIWTLLHMPCINLPGLTGPHGLPIGLQIVGRIGDDSRMLKVAAVVERALQRE
jgi:Asp-tRNA(Asn)/Glu-tRNA(Gln) amidotransferase A subunit family amidase